MTEENMSELLAHLFAAYGPAAFPVIGLLLIIKYLLDKDKERENSHQASLKAEREQTQAERKRADDLQQELLTEARGNAMLAEEVRKAIEVMALKGSA